MITTHTLGQVADLSNVSSLKKSVTTDLLTLHTASVMDQVAFNHQLFGLDRVSSEKTHCAEWYDSCTYYDALTPDTTLKPELHLDSLLSQIDQAKKAGFNYKPAIIGPVSLLQTLRFESDEQRLQYLDVILPLYTKLLAKLAHSELTWLQLDEAMLTQPLTKEWRHAYRAGYFKLQRSPVKLMVATSCGTLNQNLQLACQLPVQGLHVDALASRQMMPAVDWLPRHKVLSLGVIDGQELAKSDLTGLLTRLKPVAERLKERLWLAPNVAFVHLPTETSTADTKQQNAFEMQKIRELNSLAQALKDGEFKQPIRLFRSNTSDDVKQPLDKAKVA